MPYRWTKLRIVDPSVAYDRTLDEPISLWRAALAAAEETLQGGPLTTSWLRLFNAHLSQSDHVFLRWAGDLGTSAELRRAYSGIYGRYFARAILASRIGLQDFIPLRRNITTLPGGVIVRRTGKGDIPDWIAWDSRVGGYALAEAKGNLTGSPQLYLNGEPPSVSGGKAQFNRVIVVDASGQSVSTKNWVAANLWATDERGGPSISLLWEPTRVGKQIPFEERPLHRAAIRRRRLANLALGLRRTELIRRAPKVSGPSVRITAEPTAPEPLPYQRTTRPEHGDDVILPDEAPATKVHTDVYVAVVFGPSGPLPIASSDDIQTALQLRETDEAQYGPALVFGVTLNSAADTGERATWLSGSGIASTDGACLFDLRKITLEPA